VVASVPPATSASITHAGTIVRYEVTTTVITIHADRDYRREITIITLWADVAPATNFFAKFAEHCVREQDARRLKRGWIQKIHRNDVEGKWSQHKGRSCRKMETVVLKSGQSEELVTDFDEFLSEEAWYLDRDVPYTRGYMFQGSPGTGKSSMIQAMAGRSKRHLHYLILGSVTSDEMLFSLLEKINFATTILIIEDIDCASQETHARTAAPEKAPAPPEGSDATAPEGSDAAAPEGARSTLTLGGLLNGLDGGMLDTHGRVVIMTTNHPEVLDRALVRSGRIDITVDFSNCTGAQADGIYATFFDTPPPTPATDAMVSAKSPADVAGLFVRHKKNPEVAWAALTQSPPAEVETAARPMPQ
jgi:hypothetical protein